ncbi:MAG: DedA family protein [Desulfovibrio sp.]|nr:DedA family protein [Desulfovibrio sp.]
MEWSRVRGFLRRHWYIFPAAVLGVAAACLLFFSSGRDPAEMFSEWGYLIIIVWTFLEGETIVVLAGMTAASVGLEPRYIALSAFCGSFTSDQVMFTLGKYKGEAVLNTFPRIAKNMDKAKRLLQKYDTAMILGFRFIYGVRNVTPIMLGISGVSRRKFFLLNAAGAGVWALTFTYGGHYAGQAFMHMMERVGHGILYALLALAAALIVWRVRAARKNR